MQALQAKAENTGRNGRRRGHAVVELSFLLPWFLFLFAGAFDIGMYSYDMISTENAARVAALYTSSLEAVAADSTLACQYALAELKTIANANSLTSCGPDLPVNVTATAVTGVDGAPASLVAVTYKSPQLIPIPGLMGQLTITRTVQMRVRDFS